MKKDWHSEIDGSWTLFLDRDGVINEKLPGDYVKQIDEFQFLPGVLDALEKASRIFDVIVVVTNQQGIGKGIMTDTRLFTIHQYMIKELFNNGGRIDKIYFCPDLEADNPSHRKPRTGMAFDARADYPSIEFAKSIIAGDSPSDMEFGQRLGMKCVGIGAQAKAKETYPSLFHFIDVITSK